VRLDDLRHGNVAGGNVFTTYSPAQLRKHFWAPCPLVFYHWCHMSHVLGSVDVQIGKSPLSHLQVGQEVTAVAFPTSKQAGVQRELSLRPSVLTAAGAGQRVQPQLNWSSVVPGEKYISVVSEVQGGHSPHIAVALTSQVKGRVSILMASSIPDHLANLARRFPPGSLVAVTAISHHSKLQRLDLSLLPHPDFAMLGPKSGDPQVCLRLLFAHPSFV
jgi:hypothetical protein